MTETSFFPMPEKDRGPVTMVAGIISIAGLTGYALHIGVGSESMLLAFSLTLISGIAGFVVGEERTKKMVNRIMENGK